MDCAPNKLQLMLKEAMHIKWENSTLNRQAAETWTGASRLAFAAKLCRPQREKKPLAPTVVSTIKPRQTNAQCYRVMQLRSVSIQQKVLKEEIFTWPKLYPTSAILVTSSTATESAAIITKFLLSQFKWFLSYRAEENLGMNNKTLECLCLGTIRRSDSWPMEIWCP